MGKQQTEQEAGTAGAVRGRRLFNDRSLVIGLPLLAALIFSSVYFVANGFRHTAQSTGTTSTSFQSRPGGLTVEPLANPTAQNASTMNAINSLQPSASSPDVPESYLGQRSNTVGPAPTDSSDQLQNLGSTQTLLNGSSHTLKHWQGHQK